MALADLVNRACTPALDGERSQLVCCRGTPVVLAVLIQNLSVPGVVASLVPEEPGLDPSREPRVLLVMPVGATKISLCVGGVGVSCGDVCRVQLGELRLHL